jgi:hypothetical protein
MDDFSNASLGEGHGEVGYPSRVSRKGKAGPLEAGRGKYSPPASPERVTSKARKRKDKGFRSGNSRNLSSSRKMRKVGLWTDGPWLYNVFQPREVF